MLVTILFLTTVFLFHLNLSSTNRLKSRFQQNKASTFELPHRIIYPSQTIFREFITPTLNSEKICSLYKIFQSKNPSLSPKSFLPPTQFFKSNTSLMIRKVYGNEKQKLQQNIIYSFNFGEKTQYSKFNPILYNPIDKKLETSNSGNFFDKFKDTTDISDDSIFWNEHFIPLRPYMKPLDDENKTIMFMRENITCSIILEDSTDKNLKQYSLIYNGKNIVSHDISKNHSSVVSHDISKNHSSPPKMCLII